MAYKSYLLDKYEFTHENRFFRLFDEKLKEVFENETGDHILIGNIGVGGHSLDAIFLKRGAIAVIDFKDYAGDLTFSENGPWQLKLKEGKTLFVAGGAHSRNPFQQVNAYRFALFQFLSEKREFILDINHTDVRWEYTNCIVLFHRDVHFEQDTIPPKIQRYFHIACFSNIINLLKDLHSKSLNFSDNELKNILTALNVTEDDLYDSDITEFKETPEKTVNAARMERIKSLIPTLDKDENETIRSLAFYDTMLSIERTKEASVNSICSHPINWNNVENAIYNINIETNNEFLDVWLRNSEERFPKNLFVSVNLQFGDTVVPFFYTILHQSDIEDIQNVTIDFDSFELFGIILKELNLTEDIIGELATFVNEKQTIHEKISVAEEYLDVTLDRLPNISLGLSQESLFTAQLQSELRQWINKKRTVENSPVFNSILTHTAIPSVNVKRGDQNDLPLLQITELNNSQKEAVALSFKQPLTIIAGPPGTGKSQVVANILANAVFKNEKVLFSSKNNKAVDNVHERINKLLKTNYFLRQGTRIHNSDFVDVLETIMIQINTGNYPNKSDELKNNISELENRAEEKTDLKSKLQSIVTLENEIPLLENNIAQKTQSLDNWVSTIKEVEYDLYISKSLKLDITQSKLNELKRIVNNSKSSWYAKLFFNWFKKSKLIQCLNRINASFPQEVKSYIDNLAPIISRDGDIIDGFQKHINCIKEQKKTQEEISVEYSSRKNEINRISEGLRAKQESLNATIENKDRYQHRIKEINRQQASLGQDILSLTINEKLRVANLATIDTYKSYIENGLPWQTALQAECANNINAFLSIFNSISITSLNIKKGFLQEPGVFDLLVIDEASQCDITSAIPLIYRAKRVVVIGDSLQLPHITSIQKYEQKYVLEKLNLATDKYNYIDDSLYNKAEKIKNLSLLESVFLDQHYRSHPDIINFSNHNFYLPKAGKGLEVMTRAEDFTEGKPGIHWVDIKGEVAQQRNENMAEVQACVDLVQKLASQHPNASIGVTTPFKHQKTELQRAIKDLSIKNDILCDVIHKFQGDEKDIIILSLVVTGNAKVSLAKFINESSPYLLNVGVTRAKSSLYIVGDKSHCLSQRGYWNQKTLLAKLADYVNLVNN